jgi:hypothetical protein
MGKATIMTNKKSNYHRDSKDLRGSRSGVSEIIGNLLILAITVSLFSGVLFYVESMPAPQNQTSGDFKAQTGISGSNLYINITHQGGQTLNGSATNIYLFKNNVPTTLSISSSNPSIGSNWNIGNVWSYIMTGYTSTMTVSLMIVDKTSNSIVWQATLAGNTTYQNTPPIIGDRGLTPSPVYDQDKVYFFVTVTDLNSNIKTVWVNAASLGINGNITLYDTNHDGTFTSTNSYTASYSGWNGRTIFFSVNDTAKNSATAQFVVAVSKNPSGSGGSGGNGIYNNYSQYLTNGTYPPDASGGEAGETSGQAGTTFYYIERASDGTITRTFSAGQKVLIILYSDKLRNLALLNNFTITNPTTGKVVFSSVAAFQYYGIYGDFYCYSYNFTAPSSPNTYPIKINLEDNIGTIINIQDRITVGGSTFVPTITTYKWNSTSNKFVKCQNFTTDDTVYVEINTIDVDGKMTGVFLNDLTVSDYSGEYILRATPDMPVANPSGSLTPAYTAPMSSVYKTNSGVTSPTQWISDSNTGTSGTYIFYFKVVDANSGWWLPMRNSYTMTIAQFSDTGDGGGRAETYYSLTDQFNVTAPRSMTDIIASIGSGSFTWSSTGASWSSNEIAWYENGQVAGQWQKVEISPSTSTYAGPIGMVQADFSGDGRADLAVAFQSSTVAVAWYKSLSVDGTEWSTPYVIALPIDGTPGGVHDNSTSDTGMANADSTVYSTYYGTFMKTAPDGTICYSSYDIIAAMASGDFGNGRTDLVVSVVHVVVYSTATSQSGETSPTANTAMYFNRGIYVLWNNGGATNWEMTPLYGTRNYDQAAYGLQGVAQQTQANGNNNPAAMSIAVGDFNKDGCDDIVAVYENGTTSIWLSQWKSVAGNSSIANPFDACFNTSASYIPNVSPSVPGSNPWGTSGNNPTGRIALVKVADLDNNGYPDIIRTSTATGYTGNIYTILTKPITTVSTDVQYPVTFASGLTLNAAVSGTNASLANGGWQNLTEIYQNSSVINIYPTSKGSLDTTTGTSVSSLQSTDSNYYAVTGGKILNVVITTNPSQTPVTNISLTIVYKTSSPYAGKTSVLWSTDNTHWQNTSLTPTLNTNPTTRTYYFTAQNLTSYGKTSSIYIYFKNSQATTTTVSFDSICLAVKYAVARQLNWIWEIPNTATDRSYLLHYLTMEANTTGLGGTFSVSYSLDGVTYIPMFQVNGAGIQNYYYSFPNSVYMTNSMYYIKVTATDTMSSTNKTLCVKLLDITSYPLNVNWVNGQTASIPISSNYYISCMAVGDIGSNGGIATSAGHKTDGYADIVVGTTDISSSDTSHALYVITNNGQAFSTAQSIPVVMAGTAVGTNNYIVTCVAIGDFDGDGTPDIAMAIGYAPGYTAGSAPTLWVYYNNNPTTASSWQFNEQAVNILTTGSIINMLPGNVNLILQSMFPFFGVLGIVGAEAVIERYGRRRNQP